MNGFLSGPDIETARTSWVAADVKEPVLRAARSAADLLVARHALQDKISGFDIDDDAIEQLRNVAFVYEIAASGTVSPLVEGFELRRATLPQQKAIQGSAFLAYELARALPSESQGDAIILDTLTLCALGYLGDRGVDLEAVLRQSPPPLQPSRWDLRVLFTLYDCWCRLFRRETAATLDEVGKLVAELRLRQNNFENAFLNSAEDPFDRRNLAFRLLALYHWARATELLAAYLRGGSRSEAGPDIDSLLERFFQDARKAAAAAGDRLLETLLWWLHAAAKRMTELSIWRFERGALASLVRSLATQARPIFEFLPPQRQALLSANILDAARTAIVVDMPTSSGKTLLAEFRIAQTVAAVKSEKGWVAYIVPTRALAAQITRRLRRDLGPEITVEALSAAMDVDALEEDMLATDGGFDVLVCTPEKLAALFRQRKVQRPLALVVVDEAQSIADKTRGLRIELLLATVRSETVADFMLMMPHVPNGEELSKWLERDAGSASYVSLSSVPWKPNDVLITTFSVQRGENPRDWTLRLEPLVAPRSLKIEHVLKVNERAPLKDVTFRKARDTAYLASAAAAVALQDQRRGVNVVMCIDVNSTWRAAERIAASLSKVEQNASRDLLKRFVETEISPDFALVKLLEHGVAVHHAGLPDDVRTLIELLAEDNELRVLCATSTIAQGMNFNVGSVFLSSLSVKDGKYPRGMHAREFWNVAGRAGRVGQMPVGIVGVYGGKGNREHLEKLINDYSSTLRSQFENMVRAISTVDPDHLLGVIRKEDDWADFRSYVTHMTLQTERSTANDAEQLLRNTFAYRKMSTGDAENRRRADVLLQATRQYMGDVLKDVGSAKIADATGFDPRAIWQVRRELRDAKLADADWRPESIFSGKADSVLPRLIGAMLRVPQIERALADLGGHGSTHQRIADISSAWVKGDSIEDIANTYFRHGARDTTEAISKTCRAIFRALTFAAPWGLSSAMQFPGVGIDFDKLTDEQRHSMNMLPAYVYHGVKTEAAVAMRMNNVPRSIAQSLADLFETRRPSGPLRSSMARDFLKSLTDIDWELVRPPSSRLSGADYRAIWKKLSSA